MALSIKNRETEDLARKLAHMQRKPITLAVHDALAKEVVLENELSRLSMADDFITKLLDIQNRVAKLPRIDNFDHNDFLYDENGIPH